MDALRARGSMAAALYLPVHRFRSDAEGHEACRDHEIHSILEDNPRRFFAGETLPLLNRG